MVFTSSHRLDPTNTTPADVEEHLLELPDFDSTLGLDVEYDSEDDSSSEEDSTDT